jgi:hypothetical protein
VYVWLRLAGFLGLWNFPISDSRQLFYDFAPWRRLLIRDNQLTVRSLVNVIASACPCVTTASPRKRAKQDARFKVVPRQRPLKSATVSLGFH